MTAMEVLVVVLAVVDVKRKRYSGAKLNANRWDSQLRTPNPTAHSPKRQWLVSAWTSCSPSDKGKLYIEEGKPQVGY